jgi:hypothetical protein
LHVFCIALPAGKKVLCRDVKRLSRQNIFPLPLSREFLAMPGTKNIQGGKAMKKLLIVLSLALMIGCAANQASSPQNFSAQLPQNWYQVNTTKFYILTKDGPYSQYILVQQRPIDKPFAHTSKTLNRAMSPKEVATVFVEEMTNDEAVLNLRLLENKPARVNVHDGFRLVFTYGDKEGHNFQTYMYGFLAGDSFYSLRYNAEVSSYCNQDIEEFHKFVRSFKINNV